MGKKFITLLIAVLIGLIVGYFASHDINLPLTDIQKAEREMKKIKSTLDSLEIVLYQIRAQRHQDSLKSALRLRSNKQGIDKLKNDIQTVNFDHYNNRKLDSLVMWLYPSPR